MTHVQVNPVSVVYAVDTDDTDEAFKMAYEASKEYVVTVTVAKDDTPTVSITRRQSHK